MWLFSNGPSGEGNPRQLVEGWRLSAEVRADAFSIRPRDVAVFHGNIDPQKINGMEKFDVKSIVKKPFGDYCNWNRITLWAEGVAAALKEEAPQR